MGDLVKDGDNTKEQLVHELSELHSQNAALEKSITGNISDELAVEEARRNAEIIMEAVREPLDYLGLWLIRSRSPIAVKYVAYVGRF
jgi:hypothetical protein